MNVSWDNPVTTYAQSLIAKEFIAKALIAQERFQNACAIFITIVTTHECHSV